MNKKYFLYALLTMALAAGNTLLNNTDATAADVKNAPPPKAQEQPKPPLTPEQAAKEAFQKTLNDANQARNQKKFDDAVKLYNAILADKALAKEDRAEVLKNLALCFSNQEKFEDAIKANEELLALPIGDDQKANILIANANFYSKLKNTQKADEIRRIVVADQKVSGAVRTAAFIQLTERMMDKNKAGIAAEAKELLADKSLKAGDAARIYEQIAKASEDRDKGALTAAANALLNLKEAANSYKISVYFMLAKQALADGDAAEAIKFANSATTLPDLAQNDYIRAWINVGTILEWQQKPAEAYQAYAKISAFKKEDANLKNQENKTVADARMRFMDFDGAAKVYRDSGDFLAEADVLAQKGDDTKAREIRLKIIQDEKAPEGLRRTAYERLIGRTPEEMAILDKYLAFYIGDSPNRYDAFWNHLNSAMQNAAYPAAVKFASLLVKSPNHKNRFLANLYYVNALAGTYNYTEAAKIAEAAAANEKFTMPERYQMALAAAALKTPEDSAAMKNALKKVDQDFADAKLANKERSNALVKAGRTAMIGNKEIGASEIYAVYESLYVPEPKRCYPIEFTDAPLDGITSWDALKKQPQRAKMDRKFGGGMEFLVTDVSTGDRGAGIGSATAKKDMKYPEFSVLCDVKGVHFLFEAFDDRVNEIKAKLANGDSYEGYIAAGENQPYYCFLLDGDTGKVSIWNSHYNTRQHRHLPEGSDLVKTEHRCTSDGYKTYLFFSWDVFYDKLPEKGDLWDFENIQWSRFGGFSWNGIKGIHARSSWGNLTFNLNDAQRLAIKRQILFNAYSRFKPENATRRIAGVIDFWRDKDLGDYKFYEEVVAPYVAKLDEYGKMVKVAMSAADAELLFREAVPGWNEIRFKIAELRHRYLEEKFSE